MVAKIATISCVKRPVAIWMQYLQPSTAATFSCYICNFTLQTLQLHKLLIQKLLTALFAPISCNLEEERTITSLRLEPMTFHTKPSCSTENDEKKCGRWCTNGHFPLNLQLLGAASNTRCKWILDAIFASKKCTFTLQPIICRACNQKLKKLKVLLQLSTALQFYSGSKDLQCSETLCTSF